MIGGSRLEAIAAIPLEFQRIGKAAFITDS
jgi:hypothetical protein